jgi:hypothetical protein
MKRIHIVGVSPRTGTTLMAEAMKTCFAIDCYGSHEIRLVSRPKGNCNIFLTKCPRDIMIVGPGLRVDPDLYVICMIRDPRDIICSRHKIDPGHYWASLKFWNLYSKRVDKLVQHPHFIPIRYEDFVSNPDKVQAFLVEKIPFLEQQISFSEYHKTASISEASQKALRSIRPIKPTSVGKWRKHKSRVAGQLKLHGSITNDLIKFGYEKDDQWLRELDGVAPDTCPSHFSEYTTFKEERLRKLGKYMEAARRFVEQKMGRRFRITHPKKWISL